MFHESSDSDEEHRLLSSISHLTNMPHMDFHLTNSYPPQPAQQRSEPMIEVKRMPAKKGRTGVVWSAQFVRVLPFIYFYAAKLAGRLSERPYILSYLVSFTSIINFQFSL